MKLFVSIGLFCVLSVSSVPVDPFDEVELVEPTNTNSKNPDFGGFFPAGGDGNTGRFPIVIVRTQSGRNPFGGFPFGRRSPFGGFPFHSQFPEEVDEVDSELPVPEIGTILRSIFGIPHTKTDRDEDEGEVLVDEQEEEDEKKNCGLICTLVGDLHKIHAMVEDEIKDVHQKEEDRENEIEGESPLFVNDDGADGNSTYTEEIRPDGSVVRTNRTVVKSPNGVSFVFTQTTSFGNNKNVAEDEKEIEKEQDKEEEQEQEIDIRNDEDPLEETKDENVDEFQTPLLVETNEVFDDDDDDESGIDGGLIEILE